MTKKDIPIPENKKENSPEGTVAQLLSGFSEDRLHRLPDRTQYLMLDEESIIVKKIEAEKSECGECSLHITDGKAVTEF